MTQPPAHETVPKDTLPNWAHEELARQQGYHLIAGVDEVGRGCLFGPVYAAAVILDPDQPLEGLDDSKRLKESERVRLATLIQKTATAHAIGIVDAAEIDLINIREASRLAMKVAIEQLLPAPDFVLVDAMQIEVQLEQRSIIKGDRKSCSIAAASILAKVARDECMLSWDAVYPQYDLRSNKGYPTSRHLTALEKHGCSPLHRFSYKPVARFARLHQDGSDTR